MFDLNDLLKNGIGDINITVTLNDLYTFATTLLQGVLNKLENTSDPEDEFMTRQQVMAYLNIKETTLHNWSKQGILVPRKINRKCYYSKNDILALQRGDTKILIHKKKQHETDCYHQDVPKY